MTTGADSREAEETEETAESGRQAIRRFLIGLHPKVTIEGRRGTALFVPEPEHRGAPGWVHGGFLATILDHAGARIANAVLDSSVATGTLDLRYRQPVLLAGGPYPIAGEAITVGSRTARIEVAILSPEGRPLTEGTGLFVAHPIPS